MQKKIHVGSNRGRAYVTPEDWGKRYADSRKVYEEFTLKMHELIKTLLKNHPLDVANVESRTKEVERFINKIKRKGGKYRNPLREITDLSGLRIITYYKEDVEIAAAIIRDEFSIDPINTVHKFEELDVDRFGYLSEHYVVSLSSDRMNLNEWTPYKGLKAEIQVRSVSQHAWAAINRKLGYQKAEDVPHILRRRLFRLSALFELADEEFTSVRTCIEDTKGFYLQEIKKKNYDIELNLDSISVYLNHTAIHKRFAKKASEHALYTLDSQVAENFIRWRKISLLEVLRGLGLQRLRDLHNLIPTDKNWNPRELQILCKEIAGLYPVLPITTYDILIVILLYLKKNKVTKSQINQTGFVAGVKRILIKRLVGHS